MIRGRCLARWKALPARIRRSAWTPSGLNPSRKDQAQTLGYTVVDASTVVATHLNQILQKHAHELIGHEEAQKWLDQLEKISPKLAEELVLTTDFHQHPVESFAEPPERRSAGAGYALHCRSHRERASEEPGPENADHGGPPGAAPDDCSEYLRQRYRNPGYHVGSRPGTVIAKVCSAESTIRRSG